MKKVDDKSSDNFSPQKILFEINSVKINNFRFCLFCYAISNALAIGL